jgi:hypothetical protein
MIQLSTGTLLFFGVAMVLALLLPFLRGEIKPSVSLALKREDWKPFGLFLAPFALLYGIALLFHWEIANSFLYFFLGFTLTWLITRLALPAEIQGNLLLVTTLLLTLTLKDANYLGLSLVSYLAGLTTWAVKEIFIPQQERPSWQPVIPSLCWLSALYWIQLTMVETQQPAYQNLIIGALGLAAVLGSLEKTPLPLGEKFCLKPLVLALTGGLGMWLLINNILVSPNLLPWAGLFAGGIILAKMLKDQSESSLSLPHLFIALILMGIGTLFASRIFGALGWVMLAVSMLVFLKPRFVMYAGLFWLIRLMLQGFIYAYNPNVTGINVTHPYASAALYGGLALGLTLPILLGNLASARNQLAGFLGGAILLPLTANYFFQSETIASLLLAVTIAGAIGVFLAGTLYSKTEDHPQPETMLFFPLIMTLTAILSNPLIDIGTQTTRSQKLTVLLVIFILLTLGWFGFQKTVLRRKTV